MDEKAVPFFKAGKELRERVNRGKPARAVTSGDALAAQLSSRKRPSWSGASMGAGASRPSSD